MQENIEQEFLSKEYNTSSLEEGNDVIVEYKGIKMTLTTVKNQKDDKNNINMTTVDLGNCEILLKKAYNIPDDEMIFMIKTDVFQEGMKIPKITFVVYGRLNRTNLIKLNLSYCENSKIDLSIPIKITENIDKLNASSGYYNDLCYIATSDSGTDINLNDRKNEFVDNNRTVCQDGCIFSNYDNKKQKAKCSCDIVEHSSSNDKISIDKSKLYENFLDIKNIANINLLKCYKVLFSINGIKKNYGCYSLIPIFLSHFAIIIVFYGKNYYKVIKDKIYDIKYGISNWNLVKEEKRKNRKIKRLRKKNLGNVIGKKRKQKQKFYNNKEEHKEDISPQIDLEYHKKYEKKLVKQIIKKHKIQKDFDKNNTININNDDCSKGKINNIENFVSSKSNKIESLEKIKQIMSKNDEEINNLSYKKAKKYDKRNYFQYFVSLLKTKHIVIFTFFNNNDYNSKIIKINLFLFNFSLFYVVNAFFFSDNTMHKIYEDKGSFNFIYQLPQIIYSSLISIILDTLVKLLALSEGLILDYKKNKKKENLDQRIFILENKLKIRFISYFIISTILYLFFWYYISMFCAIYVNTQIHLIKDTLISFGLESLYPFGIYILPCIFRILSLSYKKKFLYYISLVFQML